MRNKTERFKAGFFLVAMLLFPCLCSAAEDTGITEIQTTAEDRAGDIQTAEKAETIADGVYVPEKFIWTGGSGRAGITCPEVVVYEGQAYATIVFGSTNYGYVRIEEEKYLPSYEDGTAVFEIPVVLNEDNTIIGMTTAMSSEHEITYTIYIGMTGNGQPAASPETGMDQAEGASDLAEMETAAGVQPENMKAGVQTDAELEEDSASSTDGLSDEEKTAPEIEGLVYESAMELDYAKGFGLYYYQDGYAVADVYGSARYLIVPENMPVPDHLDEEYVVLQKPLDHIYLTATSVMALYDALGAIGNVRMTGTQASGWYVDAAVEALENGEMVFAGKYSEPDYELLLNMECDLSIQSTMILHSPKVKELLENLGIPVFVDYCNYEQHPLGKPEWIRLYGFLADKEDEAEAFWADQKQMLSKLENFENTEKTVAYFYVNTNSQVNVREVSDSIPSMIEMAGGRYIFQDHAIEGNTKNTATITMEEFYDAALQADYLVYNSSIDSSISTIEELLAKSELFADFKAVQEGNVWCTGKSVFQATDQTAEFMMDLNKMLTGGDEDEMVFLKKCR